MASRILLINGPNLNLLGTREPSVYGSTTLADVVEQAKTQAAGLNVHLEAFQSNHEGAIVDRIHDARGTADAIVINPGAYTHTSVAIRDALLGVDIPFVETHISNVHAREAWRRHSYLSDKAVAVICGLGTHGYTAAVEFAARHMKMKEGRRHRQHRLLHPHPHVPHELGKRHRPPLGQLLRHPGVRLRHAPVEQLEAHPPLEPETLEDGRRDRPHGEVAAARLLAVEQAAVARPAHARRLRRVVKGVARPQRRPQPLGVDDLHVEDARRVHRRHEPLHRRPHRLVRPRHPPRRRRRVGVHARANVERVEAQPKVGPVHPAHHLPARLPRVAHGAPAERLEREPQRRRRRRPHVRHLAEVGNVVGEVARHLLPRQHVARDLDEVRLQRVRQLEPDAELVEPPRVLRAVEEALKVLERLQAEDVEVARFAEPPHVVGCRELVRHERRAAGVSFGHVHEVLVPELDAAVVVFRRHVELVFESVAGKAASQGHGADGEL
ncbi:hypothetical protein BN1723_003812 [Verticillium longisporum]|uniref:Catabolic 3-dehydroquinase n=1 Tax=Verticillium longisporum TaxID=100787 RepID=A0A0G4MCW2_VERLO|nr:hypothetical protein BN1723_003812 [Verticillium longisporum]